MLKSLLLFLISLCLVGQIYGFGYVDPETIYAFENEVNQTIECSFNPSQGDGLTSADLLFNETCDNSDWVIYNARSPNVEVLSESKIRIRLPNRPYSRCKYVCQLRNSNVAFTSVFIGKRLSNVKNFKCRSQDWRNMTCEFTEMDNYIPLTYDLTYKLDHKTARNQFQCPLKNDSKRGRFCDVYFDGARDGSKGRLSEFFQADDSFYFTLVSRYAERTGLPGKNVESFDIDHLASVVPSAPIRLRPEKTTANSVNVHFVIPSNYTSSRIRFDYDITLKSEYDREWQSLNDSNHENISPRITELLIPLEHAFTKYDIRVRMKSHDAPDKSDMWSPYATTEVRTLSKIPDRAPTSTFGAFYIHDDDNLTIYWQQLKKYEENGPQFDYNIVPWAPKEKKDISAEFSHLKLAAKAHDFKVYSTNINGTSMTPLTIHVPQKRDLLDIQISLVQTYNENRYNLTWTCKGSDVDAIESFVIFSCESKSGNPNTCDDQLKFVTIEKEAHSLIFPAEPKLIFAIAAYGKSKTTGMQWNECRANAPNYIGKLLHAAVDRREPESLSVTWKVDCSDKLIVQMFNVTICKGDISTKCRSYFAVGTARGYLIEGLKPFTNYKILISMISTIGKAGAASEVHDNTTETAPSAPRSLSYTNLTSNSVLLQWVTPEHINGIIRHHRIYFYSYEQDRSTNETDRYIIHKHEKDMQINSTSYVLDALESFTKYDVYISACTVECSKESSNIVKFQTQIGAPKNTSVPKVDKETISWSEPTHVGGNITFYELKIESRIDQERYETIRFYRMKGHSCQISNLCPKETNEYRIRVRAVNVIDSEVFWVESYESNETRVCEAIDDDLFGLSEGQLLVGEWSESLYNCYSNKPLSLSTLTGFICGIILFVLFCIGIYWIYNKIYECSNIDVVVPDGLKDISVKDPNKSQTLMTRFFRRPGSRLQGPDIILVHATTENNAYIEYNGVMIMRESEVLFDDTRPNRTDHNEYLEPLLQAPVHFRTDLDPIDEAPEIMLPLLRPQVPQPRVVPTGDLSSPYVPMTALERKPPPQVEQLPMTSPYVPITKGFTQENYFGNVVQPTPRHFIRDLLKIKQMQQQRDQQVPVETSFQQQGNVSDYVPPGFTGR